MVYFYHSFLFTSWNVSIERNFSAVWPLLGADCRKDKSASLILLFIRFQSNELVPQHPPIWPVKSFLFLVLLWTPVIMNPPTSIYFSPLQLLSFLMIRLACYWEPFKLALGALTVPSSATRESVCFQFPGSRWVGQVLATLAIIPSSKTAHSFQGWAVREGWKPFPVLLRRPRWPPALSLGPPQQPHHPHFPGQSCPLLRLAEGPRSNSPGWVQLLVTPQLESHWFSILLSVFKLGLSVSFSCVPQGHIFKSLSGPVRLWPSH